MHKIFGIKEDVIYEDREGAYIIPIQDNKIGIIETPKGYFFVGGGLEDKESHMTCIERECFEEAGYTVYVKQKICSAETYTKHSTIGYFHPIQTYYVVELLDKIQTPIEQDHAFLWIDYEQLKGNMFLEMQNWALEQIFEFDGEMESGIRFFEKESFRE